jgi:lysophospholipase L1-like esterase
MNAVVKSLIRVLIGCWFLGGWIATQAASPDAPRPAKADFAVAPEIFLHHTKERAFIGPGMFLLENGDILMAAPWGRPPTNFEQLAAKFPVPTLYRSRDGGRIWEDQGRMSMEWTLPGMVSDGGVSFLRLKDGRLAVLLHRHVKELHGGGLPAISFSSDDGATWTPARLVGEPEGVWYVMNDRLIQTRSGRLLVPVAHMPRGAGTYEGDKNLGLCFFSDDAGQTWKRSRVPAKLEDTRGMAEPCVAEVENAGVLMLARTGSGFLYASRSDDGGDTWSEPQPTTLVSACSSLTLKTLPDGRLIVFYNHAAPIKAGAFFPRTPLCYAVSGDGGRTWGDPVMVDDEGADAKDRQNIYPSVCFTKEGMLVMWSTHGADPKGSFAGQYDPDIGGAKRAIIKLPPKDAASQISAVAGRAGSVVEADVCIYGGTSGGVAAAVQAARMGKKVVIAEPGKHLGGMTAGGLSAVDIGDPRTVGGISREYFTRLVASYGKTLEWEKPFEGKGGPATGGAYSIEPHVAERVFNEMVRESKVAVHFQARIAGVTKERARIAEIVMEEGTIFRAKMFIDATYEGDLMAKAGATYTVMREGNAKHGETYNGIHYSAAYQPRTNHQKPGANGRVPGGQGVWDRDFPLDPYVFPGDPKSGLLPLLNEGEPGKPGEPAPGVQAYCFRLCLSTADDRLPIAPPPDYDAKRYEIIARFIAACQAIGDDMDLRWFSKHDALPNAKWDFNTATFGGNLPGASHEWPEAGYARRAEIAKEHENYHRGLLHFLATDPRVPRKVRDEVKRFGLPGDEFTDNGGWPHQIYVREGRRMVSDLVLTEHHTHGRQIAPHSIGLGSYGTDTHEIRRIVKDGVVIREGKTAEGRGGFGPYQIGYGAIVPKATECENLLVTFALSASHTAFSSIRMEPVFMVTSQSAATAACLAIDDGVSVQHVDPARLRARLLADGQILEGGKPSGKTSDAAATPTLVPGDSRILRILPLGDSITRGSYLAQKDGKATGLPHPESGGWRKALQERLRAAGVAFDFVGELNYAAFGRDGGVDPAFDPDHHGLAGFSNARILTGGVVPTPADVLAARRVREITVPGIVEVLNKQQPDVILLMSGTNGFDAPARDKLIRTIGETSAAHLFVGTILPQRAPRPGWDKVDAYNASLPAIVAAQQAAGKRVTLVDMHAATTADDLLPDGVHPNKAGMDKMAAAWFAAIAQGLGKK